MFTVINKKWGAIPVARISSIVSDDQDQHIILGSGDHHVKVKVEGPDPLSAIVSIVPVFKEWEVVFAEKGELIFHPVIAWGLTAGGTTVPITPCAPRGVHLSDQPWGLRLENSKLIDMPGGGTCSEAEFVAKFGSQRSGASSGKR